MELVCKEERRPFTWFYNSANDMFIRLNKLGRINAEVSGGNLPNPLDILEQRSKLKKDGRLSRDVRVLADPVTIKLWEYRNANINK